MELSLFARTEVHWPVFVAEKQCVQFPEMESLFQSKVLSDLRFHPEGSAGAES